MYITQATVDTRPEIYTVTPVIESSARLNMCLATGDGDDPRRVRCWTKVRMSEKSWASLAPLLDNRRLCGSIVAESRSKGIRFPAGDE